MIGKPLVKGPKGYLPDVIISLEPTEQLYDRLDDWVYFVKIFLEYQK